jgi:nucleoside-diphosphate-sugar epimerase
MSVERVLVTGGGGQLASDLIAQLAPRDAEVSAPGRSELDITDDAAVAAAFDALRPTIVFNCAAFHNVEVCEREEDRSFEVNARAVKRIAVRCADAGAQLVHLSTNYVFDGTASEPYDEGALPNPRSIYAISKLAGEYAALAYAPGALVVRTAGLYGLHGSASKGGNFVTRMVARAREQGSLSVVADERHTGRSRCRCQRHAARHELGRHELARVHRGDHAAGRRPGASRSDRDRARVRSGRPPAQRRARLSGRRRDAAAAVAGRARRLPRARRPARRGGRLISKHPMTKGLK